MTTNPYTDRQLTEFRRYLHTIPEVAMQEVNTAKAVEHFLSVLGPNELLGGVGGTGVVAIWKGASPGPVVMLRAELDALPITEINTFAHRSLKKEVSHKCGHDGHTTILLGVARELHEQPPSKGSVVLLFQPGEETGEGAPAVLADERFQAIRPECVFALHNLPGYPLGAVVIKEGGFTAAVKSLIIRLHGKTSHAAEPEHGHNPALAIAEILQLETTLSKPLLDDPHFFLITPVYVTMGDQAYGISAGYGEVHLTVRSWSEEVMEAAADRLLEAIRDIVSKHKLELETEWTHVFRANINDGECLEKVRRAAIECGNECIVRNTPFKWGEDFGCFTQEFPGVMFGLGAGENCPALHNPDYDFPDELLDHGIKLMTSVVRQLNG
jgi:amidohydrolase